MHWPASTRTSASSSTSRPTATATGIADWYEDHLVLFNGVSLKLDKNNPDTDGDGIPDGEEIDRLDYRYNADRTKVIGHRTAHHEPHTGRFGW